MPASAPNTTPGSNAGNLRGVSDSVLEALAAALQLDEAERAHLLDLAKAAAPPRSRRDAREARADVRPSIQRILAGMTGTPAYVRNSRMDIVAANNLCFALYSGILSPDTLPLNLARFMFLDPRSQDFFVNGKPSPMTSPPPCALNRDATRATAP